MLFYKNRKGFRHRSHNACENTLRVGIDAMVTPTMRTGVGRYLEALLTHLAEVAGAFEYTVFLGSNQEDLASELPPALVRSKSRISTERPFINFLRMQFVVPWLSRRRGLHVLHVPNEKLVFFKSCPLVLTIHDIGCRRVPGRHELPRRLYRRFVLRHMLRKADHLIAVSRTTATDLIKYYSVPEQKISVISEGVSRRLQKMPVHVARAIVRQHWGLADEYILFVGEIAPRKNLNVLLDAFGELIQHRNKSTHLALVGRGASTTASLKSKLAGTPLQDRVTFTGYVSDDELAALYAAASLLVLPSLYEGFGLPVIEAMAYGVPVVASATGALPEIVGSAGVLVDCSHPHQLCDQMLAVLTDESLRDRIVARGLEQVQAYSWVIAAQQTAKVYDMVARRHASGITAGSDALRRCFYL